MVDTVWVVRHGQRLDQEDAGWAADADRPHDTPLTDHGHWEAWRVGRRLAATGVDVDAIYASPFLRAVQTADEIARELGAAVRLEPGIGEHRNPDWFDAEPEVLEPATLAERFDTVVLENDPVLVPELPEDTATAFERIGEATRRLVERHADGDHLLLVGHGITIGGVATGLVGLTEHVDAPLAGLTRIERRGEGWALCFSGDTLHLGRTGCE